VGQAIANHLDIFVECIACLPHAIYGQLSSEGDCMLLPYTVDQYLLRKSSQIYIVYIQIRSKPVIVEDNGHADVIPALHAPTDVAPQSPAQAMGLQHRQQSSGLGNSTPASPHACELTKTASTNLRMRTHLDNDAVAAPGSWPMPKWPPNHESQAFDSVAFKKSLILSPPEIYAEIAHHGEQNLSDSL
jgi:hypothetical protein